MTINDKIKFIEENINDKECLAENCINECGIKFNEIVSNCPIVLIKEMKREIEKYNELEEQINKVIKTFNND